MENKGKNYANRKPESERPENDYYPTPSCLTKELIKQLRLKQVRVGRTVLEPCCGKYAISNVLEHNNVFDFQVTSRDLIYGNDFLTDDYSKERFDTIIMNPPFKLFDKFVEKAKTISPIVCCIGKMNYFGAHSRNINGLWNHLEWVLPFDRQIAYDIPEDEDGKVQCGMMITGWFIWNIYYDGYPKIDVIDVQKYIKGK